MIRKILIQFLLLVALISSFIFSACSEEPNLTGYTLLNPTDSLILKRFDSSVDSVNFYIKQVKQVENFGNLQRFLVGKYDDIIAHSLIRFNFYMPDSVKNAVKNSAIIINSARLKLFPIYRLGDSTRNNYSIEVREILSWWESDYFNIDSLKSSKYQVGSDQIQVSQSDEDSLYFIQLSNDKVFEWLRIYSADTLPKPPGILLSPSPTTEYVKGFASINSGFVITTSVIELVYTMNSIIDTIYFSSVADLHVVEKEIPYGTNVEKIVLQSGLKEKALLAFDLSSIPNRAIINAAYLRLYLNENESVFGSSYQDSIYVQFVKDSANVTIDSITSFTLIKSMNGYYEGNISYYVQKWIDGVDNQGVILHAKDPIGGLERFVFYGPGSPYLEKRAKLIINYSYKK